MQPSLVLAAQQSETRSSDLGDKQGRRWQFNKEAFPVHPEAVLQSDARDGAQAAPPGQSWPPWDPPHSLQGTGCCSSRTMTGHQVSFFISTGPCQSGKCPQGVLHAVTHGAATVTTAVCGSIQWEKLVLTHVPFLRKPAPAHHHILFCCALLRACSTGLILPTGAFCSILIFLYESKLRIKLAKTDLSALLNEARVD